MRDKFGGSFRGVLLATLLVSCETAEPEPAPAPPFAPSASAAPAAPVLPRRPTVRHYLARKDERCEVYAVDGDRVSAATRTPCPQDLQVGERIRVMGKSCMREGIAERAQPVVCPGALLTAATPPDVDAGGT
ncbi:hypothetical protein [Polyangium spumosum]|uniref:Uncharacterized protein n=1 Tax=Polyangium spumosum TaxID=889282 RepID=A0A6N7Q0D6_9BACT|nr:hypothetical protein [Polyangium spumosum]MRG95744.1 hypothetical protein [Polyangium spumosum]